jgi:hypothetical protein
MEGIVHKEWHLPSTNSKRLLRCFLSITQCLEKVSGHSVLVNTSFNKKGCPLLKAPKKHWIFFCPAYLDVLVIENYIITKKKMIKYLQLPFILMFKNAGRSKPAGQSIMETSFSSKTLSGRMGLPSP